MPTQEGASAAQPIRRYIGQQRNISFLAAPPPIRSLTVVYPPTGSMAKDTETSTHAYAPSWHYLAYAVSQMEKVKYKGNCRESMCSLWQRLKF